MNLLEVVTTPYIYHLQNLAYGDVRKQTVIPIQ